MSQTQIGRTDCVLKQITGMYQIPNALSKVSKAFDTAYFQNKTETFEATTLVKFSAAKLCCC